MTAAKPVVAIIGRPNVGKSTLFNRIIRKRMAIVDDEPGITRDRLYAETDWSGCHFFLVDTGGLQFSEKADLPVAIADQAKLAISEADVVLFMVDLQVPPTIGDIDIAHVLHRAKKKVILVLNKADLRDSKENIPHFLDLGLGEGIALSSLHGHNIGELLDQIVQRLPKTAPHELEVDGIQVAILGRPNVGKSSLVNAIVGEKRVIVDAVPGTTRDAVDTVFHLGRHTFVLIDTAGLRKRSKVKGGVDFYSTLRTLRSLDRCHVALILVDAVIGPTGQDLKIARQVQEAYKSIILVLNKWDLVEREEAQAEEYERQVKKRYPSLSYVPIVAASALTGLHVPLILEQVLMVFRERSKRISTGRLNKFVVSTVARKQPPSIAGKQTKIYYVTQQKVHPPTFIFFTNHPRGLSASYLRYLTNQLRGAFGFRGTPIKLLVRKRGG
ncbi:MAG: GTP-binding protein Der [candidate division Zixibacteria bacterium SM23_81]|nr:MAG: GTP-binding protein Der [candidate division Zixibacteria bacterium SM23_81]